MILPSVVMSRSLIGASIDRAVRTGSISVQQGEEALRSYTSAAEAGYAFSAVTVFGLLAPKPGAPDSVGA
jgi:hypothetical protein